jgi:hypothetical protein
MKMLILKLDLPGRATESDQLVDVARELESVCTDWQNQADEMRHEKGVVNGRRNAEKMERTIELAEALAAALLKASDLFDHGQWATGENTVTVTAGE